MAERKRHKRNPVGRPPAGERSPDQTREEVLQIAEKILGERGYAATSMQAVAEAGGITKGTLYHHFREGKDALVGEVGRRVLRRHGQGLAQAEAAAEGAEEKLVAMATWLLGQRNRGERMVRDAVRFLPEDLQQEMMEGFMHNFFGRVLRVLEDAVRAGELPPHDTGFAAWSYLGLLSEFGENRRLRADPRLPRRIVGVVLHGLSGIPRDD